MKVLQTSVGFLAFLLLGYHTGLANELPETISSAACSAAPVIDGVIQENEWQSAPPVEFEMKMVQRDNANVAPRKCQLRVMNSANALYLALRVPDETVNGSLTPINIDFALIVFCRGKELEAGDDRKIVVPGLYVDKHFTTPGKDADDSHQDGGGAMGRDQGICSIEWAIPLDSGDANDIQVKPGDAVRLNLAYFDAFQAELSDTQAGIAWGTDLDHATNWGTLQLAADVQDDGGRAFKGPAWIEAVLQDLPGPVANRLHLTDSALVSGVAEPHAKALVEYTYLDTHGRETSGKAKIYLPASVQDGKTRVPLYYSAGYELDDRSAALQVGRGYAVVTPREIKANPLVQTPNPDLALLHIARSLPFVDDARVVIGGGSAGGYMTLMLAAETFPLAGAAADVPPVNWGYNAAYFLQTKNWKKSGDGEPKQPELPVFNAVAGIAQQALPVYGDNTDEPIWYQHSPLSQLDTITCPVNVFWSTADMLVPIDQISKDWVRPYDPQVFPAGFSMDPEQLCATAAGRERAMDVLSDPDYEMFILSEPQIKQRLSEGGESKENAELPFSRAKRWSITILDEGRPEPQLGHMKYAVPWSRNNFIDHVTTGNIPAAQLTLVKLQRLMDRYAGKEWLPSRLKHLDVADSERADVVRGLRLYVAASAENAATFHTLYDQLSAERKVLEPAALAAIGITRDPQQQLDPSSADSVALQTEYDARWSQEKAWKWYAEVLPIAGCNYLPRTAVNMTEMWQEETFDPRTIDQELGWAENAGYNGVRVFVQYLVWKQDPDRLKQRMNEFLAIAEKHNIRVMLVPFCDCAFAGREPYLGRQDDPVAGVHNSGWVPSPGLKRVVDRTEWANLEAYIKDLVGHFGHDARVLIWDLYNEPGQSGLGEKSLPLVAAAFHWAREAKPDQPLTVGAWVNFEDPMSQSLLKMSDVVSFHGYDAPAGIVEKVRILRQFQRPILCTEWLCRGANNTFETILPIFASEQIGAYHWGLVAGRTQTYMPWGSKQGDPMPQIWQHDVFHPDGTPFAAQEFILLRKYQEDYRSQ